MLYKKDIEGLLLEGYELICTTYETERELIKACADSHEVLNVLYIGVYDDVSFEADDGLQVFDGDMVHKVIRKKKEVYTMDTIYNKAYELVMNIPFNGEAVVYNDLSTEYNTNSGHLLHNMRLNELTPIFTLDLSASYWIDTFSEYGIDIKDGLHGDEYETLIHDLAEGYAEAINNNLGDYIEGNE